MTDRELLELAAKAAGVEVTWWEPYTGGFDAGGGFVNSNDLEWNPLTDDGDALRLAVKLRLELQLQDYGAAAREPGKAWFGCESHLYGGIEAATRRAIVRAAAEIGRA